MAHVDDTASLLDEDEATSRIPASVVQALLADEEDDATAKIPASMVRSLIAKQGTVVPPPRLQRRLAVARRPADVGPLPDSVPALADALDEVAPPPRHSMICEREPVSAFDREWDEIALRSA
jgi:hypothetical protein